MFLELIDFTFHGPHVGFINKTDGDSTYKELTFDDFTIVQSIYDDLCFTYEAEVAEHMRFRNFYVTFKQDASIYVHTPKSFYGSDYGQFYVHNEAIEMDIFHEVFEASHSCQVHGRDSCIYQTIHEVRLALEWPCTR